MAYHDYKWEFREGPVRWRVAEMVARFYIGAGWGVAVFWLLTKLIGHSGQYWQTVAFISLLVWGVELAFPERDREAS